MIAPVSVEEALRLSVVGKPWRVRLVFDGANAANKSGKSNKWWQAASSPFDPGSGALVSWGAAGSNGQVSRSDSDSAIARAADKLRKGYRYAPDAGSPTRIESLQELVNRATFLSCTRDRMICLAGENGWIRFDPPAPPLLQQQPLVTFLAQDGSLWAALPAPGETVMYGRIRA